MGSANQLRLVGSITRGRTSQQEKSLSPAHADMLCHRQTLPAEVTSADKIWEESMGQHFELFASTSVPPSRQQHRKIAQCSLLMPVVVPCLSALTPANATFVVNSSRFRDVRAHQWRVLEQASSATALGPCQEHISAPGLRALPSVLDAAQKRAQLLMHGGLAHGFASRFRDDLAHQGCILEQASSATALGPCQEHLPARGDRALPTVLDGAQYGTQLLILGGLAHGLATTTTFIICRSVKKQQSVGPQPQMASDGAIALKGAASPSATTRTVGYVPKLLLKLGPLVLAQAWAVASTDHSSTRACSSPACPLTQRSRWPASWIASRPAGWAAPGGYTHMCKVSSAEHNSSRPWRRHLRALAWVLPRRPPSPLRARHPLISTPY